MTDPTRDLDDRLARLAAATEDRRASAGFEGVYKTPTPFSGISMPIAGIVCYGSISPFTTDKLRMSLKK